MNKQESKEQKLIDICFEVAMRLRMGDAEFKTNEECARWVAKELDNNGFKTKPVGLSWGVLYDE